MLRLLAIAAMFALAVPTLAVAQEEHPPPGPPHPAAAPHPPGPPPGGPPHPGPAFAPHGPTAGPIHPGPPGPPRPGAPGPAFAHPGGPPFPPHPGTAGFAGPPGGPPGPHVSYHGHDIERIHVNPFIYPPGYGYRRWEIGAALPPLFFAREYYYPEWAALGLEPPPPGCAWVRYGPDLLLVQLGTGQVIDVAYGVFYD
jgi:hypothetical protein